MKKIFFIALGLLLKVNAYAQAPQKMSYQAVIRGGSNELLKTTTIGMKVSLLQASTTGTPVYVETQTPTTDANGLVSIKIGAGSVQSGKFAEINWANGPYFIKTETDPKGGTAYSITNTDQLLSAPYALFSADAPQVHFIGERYGGGTVFYVYDGGQHGLIVGDNPLGTGPWANGINRITGTTGSGVNAGKMNTAMIISQVIADSASENFAAKKCADYFAFSDDGETTYSDWYLPSYSELLLLKQNRAELGGIVNYADDFFWSSTEIDSIRVHILTFTNSDVSRYFKLQPIYINTIPVRSF